MRTALLLLLALASCTPRPLPPTGPSLIPVGKPQGEAPTVRACDQARGADLDAERAEGTRIAEVCVTGGSPEARGVVTKALHLHVDSTLTATALRADLESAYATGFIDQIEARALDIGSGTLLVLSLEARRLITAVTYDGLVGLARDPILAEMPKVGTPVSRGVVHAAAEKLKDEYVSDGWDLATVDFAITPDGEGARVKLIVVEGTRAKIGKITFDGAKGGRDVGLRKAVELEDGAPLRDERLERAGLLANAFYYDNGYINVRVDRPKKTARASDGTTAISFPITEGPVFRIGKLKVSKVDAATEKQMLARMKVKPGEVFNRSKLVADLKDIADRSRQQGSPVTVEPETTLDVKAGIVDLVLAVSPASP